MKPEKSQAVWVAECKKNICAAESILEMTISHSKVIWHQIQFNVYVNFLHSTFEPFPSTLESILDVHKLCNVSIAFCSSCFVVDISLGRFGVCFFVLWSRFIPQNRTGFLCRWLIPLLFLFTQFIALYFIEE